MTQDPDEAGLGQPPITSSHPGLSFRPSLSFREIASFRDALGLAMEFGAIHHQASAAVVLDWQRRPVDLAVAVGAAGTVEAVVSWASARRPVARWPRLILLISARPMRPEVVAEADLRRYRQARWALGLAGRDLIDWIETDGDLVRSYAYLTCPASAWADDPPHHRLTDWEPF